MCEPGLDFGYGTFCIRACAHTYAKRTITKIQARLASLAGLVTAHVCFENLLLYNKSHLQRTLKPMSLHAHLYHMENSFTFLS